MFKVLDKIKDKFVAHKLAKDISKLDLSDLSDIYSVIGDVYKMVGQNLSLNINELELAIKKNNVEVATVVSKFAGPVKKVIDAFKDIINIIDNDGDEITNTYKLVAKEVKSRAIKFDDMIDTYGQTFDDMNTKMESSTKSLVTKFNSYFNIK